MEQLKLTLWGYAGKSVKEEVSRLEEEIRELKMEKERQELKMKELSEALRKSRAEEDLIREAVVDAKHLSRRLVRDAKEKATELLFEAEQDINRQCGDFERSMTTLNQLRDKLVGQKEQLELEFQETLQRYQQGIEMANTETFSDINAHFGVELGQIDQVLETSKKVIFESEVQEKLEDVLELPISKSGENHQSDEIPVYSFL